MGQFPAAEEYLAKADRLAHQNDVKAGIVEMSIIRCQMCSAVADFDRLVEFMSEVIEIGRELDVKEHMAMGLEHIASSLMFLTRFDEAWQKGQEALRVAREIGDLDHEAWLLTQTIPLCQIVKGDLDAARQTAAEGVRISSRIGASGPLICGNWLLSEMARWRGEYEQALAFGHRSVEAALPLEEYMPFFTVLPLASLGSAYLEISGHYSDEVARFHQHALKLMESPVGAMGGGTAWAELGFCALTLGDLETAETTFQKGIQYPTMFMLVERPRYLAGLALVALARGQFDQALQSVEEARDYAEERGMRYIDPLIALAAGKIRAAMGASQEALAEFERAESLAVELGMRPVIWQSQLGAAQAMAATGRVEEAQAKRQAARAVVDEIAAAFQDEQLRARYLKNVRTKIG
jgi:tetratricopeptide (TPR) repeat protein